MTKQVDKTLQVDENNDMPYFSLLDIQPSAPPEESNQDSNDSIRRYFERLTLLETIYEKLNIESNKTPGESTNQEKLSSEENPTQSHPSTDQRTETKEEVLHHSHPYSLKKLGIHFQTKINHSLFPPFQIKIKPYPVSSWK